jgi:hypothetical protein
MRLHFTLGVLSLLLSVACLVGAYLLDGYGLIWLAVPAMLVLWTGTRGRPIFWPATSLLAIYVLLAVVGIIIGASLPLLLVGSICALAAWDLAEFAGSLVGNVHPMARASLEKSRLQSLALMAGISLLLIGMDYWLRLRLPFGIIVVLVLLVTGCIVYFVHRLGNSAAEITDS